MLTHSARFLIAAAIVVSLALPTALRAGHIEDRDGRTIIHVKVFGLPDPSNPETKNRADVASVRAFRKGFPRIFAERYREKYKANPETYGNHNWDDVGIELHKASGIKVEGVESDLLAIAGGLAPDVLYINFRKSDNYIQNSFLHPLDEYIDTMTEDELNFRVNRKIWPVIKRKGPGGVKHVWAFPYGGALGKVLLFRKDLFDANDLPYPTTRWTWDDMLDAARKISDPAAGIYGIVLGRGKHESWYWCTFLWSAGGDVMSYNEERDEWRCVFDSREAATALDYYTKLSAEKWTDKEGKIRRGYSSKDASEGGHAKWKRGEIGMHLDYIDEKVLSTINPELTGMVPVPLGPTGQRGGELNSRMMGLFAEIRDPAVRDAAWEYMRFYDCEEAVKIKTAIMVQGGLGRFVNPVYLRKFGYPEIERLAPKGWSETFEIAIETGRPEPYGRNSNLAYNLMTVPIQQVENLALTDQLPRDPDKRLEVIHGFLKDACAEANEKMIGLVPPRERMKRRVAAVVTLLFIAITFALVFRKIFQAFTPTDQIVQGEQKKAWDFRRYAWAYLLLVPAVCTILVWRYVPLLRGSVMAFFDYRLLGTSAFLGVDNFGDLLFDHGWWLSVWNALRYSLFVMGLTFLPPIILAIALQEIPRGKLLFRLIYYLPAVITGLVTVVLWKQFYQPSEKAALNALVLSIPAAGFIAIGVVLLLICLAFVQRLCLHEMYLAAWCFALAGIALLVTSVGLASPILFPASEIEWATVFHPSPTFSQTSWLALGIPGATLMLGGGYTLLLRSLIPEKLSQEWVKRVGIVAASIGTSLLLGYLFVATDIELPTLKSVLACVGKIPSRLFTVKPEPYRWLQNPKTAMLSCVIPMVWAGMGPGCLIYLAALKGIPNDYYEAADIDGATFIDKILFVVFPTLKALVIINFVGVFIRSWYQATGNILVMTGGGARTETAGLHIWYEAFTFMRFGPATAMAWMLGFMLIGFTVHQLRVLSRVEFKAAGAEK